MDELLLAGAGLHTPRAAGEGTGDPQPAPGSGSEETESARAPRLQRWLRLSAGSLSPFSFGWNDLQLKRPPESR